MPQRQNETEKPKGGVLGGVRQVPYPIAPDSEGRENKERAEELPLAMRTRYLVHPAEGQKPTQWEESKDKLPLNQPTLLAGNEEAADVAVIGADRNFTVTPANPTPPTNIPSGGETPPNTPELVDPNMHAVTDAEGNEKDIEDPRTSRFMEVKTEEWQDPSYFAPQTAGMPHEAAGTEVIEKKTDEPLAEGEEGVERVISTSAGHEPYVIRPNTTHPSNDVNYEEPQLPAPVPTPPGGSTGEGGEGETGGEVERLVLESIDPDRLPVQPEDITTFTLTARGQGFSPDCVIVINDEDMETEFLSENELVTRSAPGSTTPTTMDVEVARDEETSDVLVLEFADAEAGSQSQEKREQRRKPKRKEPRKGKGKSRK